MVKVVDRVSRVGHATKTLRPIMDWFERLTGFREARYEETRQRLEVSGDQLRSRISGRSYGIGELEVVSLASLRERVASDALPGRLSVRVVTADVRDLHREPEFVRALFQVASQFNLLEMTGPSITPEQGVTRYERDPTQGPACAIAAGAATIYRNYFVPVGNALGQTSERQLDTLADLGAALASSLRVPTEALWTMRNGYALCTQSGLDAIAQHLASLSPEEINGMRGLLRIGLHRHVEVTEVEGSSKPTVTQAFCSALPVAYGSVPRVHWREFASLVLEAAYEATLLAAADNARRGGSNIVLLTSLGGGAFGNDDEWIHAATRRALGLATNSGLDVRLVSHGAPSARFRELEAEFHDQGR